MFLLLVLFAKVVGRVATFSVTRTAPIWNFLIVPSRRTAMLLAVWLGSWPMTIAQVASPQSHAMQALEYRMSTMEKKQEELDREHNEFDQRQRALQSDVTAIKEKAAVLPEMKQEMETLGDRHWMALVGLLGIAATAIGFLIRLLIERAEREAASNVRQ